MIKFYFSQMESSSHTIHENMNKVIDYQTHHRLRESQGRKRAEDLNGRVTIWAVGETLAIVFIAISQVWILKNFFSEKKPSSSMYSWNTHLPLLVPFWFRSHMFYLNFCWFFFVCFFFLFLFLSLEKLSDAWGSGTEKTLLNVLNCLLLFLPDIFDCNRNNKSRSFRCLKLCPYRSREFVVRHKRKVEEKQKEQFRLPMMLQWMQVGRQPFFVLKRKVCWTVKRGGFARTRSGFRTSQRRRFSLIRKNQRGKQQTTSIELAARQ